jgi:hypothetical protein
MPPTMHVSANQRTVKNVAYDTQDEKSNRKQWIDTYTALAKWEQERTTERPAGRPMAQRFAPALSLQESRGLILIPKRMAVLSIGSLHFLANGSC